MFDLTKEMKVIRIANAAAAGTTTITSSIFNLQGQASPGSYTNWPAGGTVAASLVPAPFDAVAIIALLNTVVATGVITLTLQDNALNQAGGMANVGAAVAQVTGTGVVQAGANCSITLTDVGGASSNGLMVLDVAIPQLQFCQVTLARSVANTTLDGIIAVLYRVKQRPVVIDASVIAQGYFVANS